MNGNMIVLNYTTKKVFRELIKCLGVIKKHKMVTLKTRARHFSWRTVQDIYFSIDNLVLEMASGMNIENTKGYDRILKHYQANALKDKYLHSISYGLCRYLPKKKRILYPKDASTQLKEKKKRGRPRKYL